jgi:hypothetical protein
LLTILPFLYPSYQPGYVYYHRLVITTQDIEDWITHLRTYGGYTYLWELVGAKRAIEAFPSFGIVYKHDAVKLAIAKREDSSRAAESDEYTDARLSWSSFNVPIPDRVEWFNFDSLIEKKETSVHQAMYKLKPLLEKDRIWPSVCHLSDRDNAATDYIQTTGLSIHSEQNDDRSTDFAYNGYNFFSWDRGFWQSRPAPPQANIWSYSYLNPFYVKDLLAKSGQEHGEARVADVLAQPPGIDKYNETSLNAVTPFE